MLRNIVTFVASNMSAWKGDHRSEIRPRQTFYCHFFALITIAFRWLSVSILLSRTSQIKFLLGSVSLQGSDFDDMVFHF